MSRITQKEYAISRDGKRIGLVSTEYDDVFMMLPPHLHESVVWDDTWIETCPMQSSIILRKTADCDAVCKALEVNGYKAL